MDRVLVESVGSFLRDRELLHQRYHMAKGEIQYDDMRKIEDYFIEDIVGKQKQHGLKIITDGELRRSWWHLDFFLGFEGIEKTYPEEGYIFYDEETRAESIGVIGKIKATEHPIIKDYEFMKKFEDDEYKVKITTPSPTMMFYEIKREQGIESYKKIYLYDKDLEEDIISAYIKVINDLYDKGLRYIQLDDTSWAKFMDNNYLNDMINNEEDPQKLLETNVYLINSVIKKIPKDMNVSIHVCRGNYHSTYFANGGYDKVSDYLFKRLDVDKYYLEFDDERSGPIDVIKDIPKDKEIVLGIVTTKNGKLEDKDKLEAKIKKALEYVDKDRLKISPQCGFASTEEGNIITEEQQWDKIELLNDLSYLLK